MGLKGGRRLGLGGGGVGGEEFLHGLIQAGL